VEEESECLRLTVCLPPKRSDVGKWQDAEGEDYVSQAGRVIVHLKPIENSQSDSNSKPHLDEVENKVACPVGGQSHSTYLLDVLQHGQSLYHKVADGVRDHHRVGDGREEDDCASVCCPDVVLDLVSQRVRCVAHFEFKFGVPSRNLEDGLVHELRVEHCDILRGDVDVADEFVFVLELAGLVDFVRAVVIRLFWCFSPSILKHSFTECLIVFSKVLRFVVKLDIPDPFFLRGHVLNELVDVDITVPHVDRVLVEQKLLG